MQVFKRLKRHMRYIYIAYAFDFFENSTNIMFWKRMSASDIELLVEKAVAKATSKTEEAIKEERRCSNYLKASQSGQFKTRAGIYEYFRAYEGMTTEEALKATDTECKGRGIGENGKIEEVETPPTMIKQIQDEAMGAVLSSLKADPMGTFQTASQIIGGLASFGAGAFANKIVSSNSTDDSTPSYKTAEVDDLPSETILSTEL